MRPWAIFPATDLALVLLLVAGAAQAECLGEGAQYAPASDPEGSMARLHLRPVDHPTAYSDLELDLLIAGRPPEVFRPEQSQGFGGTYLLADGPRLADLDFPVLFLASGPDARLVPYPEFLPQGSARAPDAVFITGLGSALWYATNGGAEPVILADEIWYLTGCD
jgi:hypothetical protein